MMRTMWKGVKLPPFLCSVICALFLVLTACNNNDVETQQASAGHENELRAMIAKYPDSLLLRESLIQYFRDNGDYEAAIKETGALLKHDPSNARFLNIEGTLYFENGDTLKAISSFEKAVALDPAGEYFVSLGSLYAQTKNPKALAVADTLLHMPSLTTQNQAVFIKGLYYSYSGDKLKAIGYFDSCLKTDYRDLLAYREKAICLYDLKKYAAALDVLQKALAIKPTFDEGYYWMGRCYEKLGKIKEAVESYQQALQIDPDYAEAKGALERLK